MKFTACSLLILIATYSIAQPSAMFETQVYFVDAAGNHDTIAIGYDTLANFIYNPAFGESEINTKYSEVFEVRACHFLDWSNNPNTCILSKRIIGNAELAIDLQDPKHICYGSEGIILFIKAKYQPVTIYWNRKHFEDKIKKCNDKSFFTPDYNYHISDPLAWVYWPNKRFACLSREDQFVVNLDRKYMDTTFNKEYTFSTIREYSNSTYDTILGVELIFEQNKPFSPCELINQTKEHTNQYESFGFVYPNPSSDYVFIPGSSSNPVIAFKIFNQNGQLINEFNDHNIGEEFHKVSIRELNIGIYFFQLKYADHSTEYKRVIKLK